MKFIFSRLFAIILILSVTAFSSVAKGLLSKQQFSERYIAKLKKTLPKAKIKRLDLLGFNVKLSDGQETQVFLDNAYADYKQNPSDLKEIINNYIGLLSRVTAGTKQKLNPNIIIPIVRSRYYYLQATKQIGKKAKLIYKLISPELYMFYAFDFPKTTRILMESDLKSLNLKASDLHRLALKNLKRKLGPQIKLKSVKSLYVLEADGVYESSLILLDSLWSRKKMPTNGAPVVFLPKRNLLVISGSQDIEGLRIASGFTRQAFSRGGRVLTTKAHIRRNGKWVPYTPRF